MTTSASITHIGNAGFEIHAGGKIIFIDAFYSPNLNVGAAPCKSARQVTAADLILVTHLHGDHYAEGDVIDLQARTGAVVAGSEFLGERLARHVKAERLLRLDPVRPATGQPAVGCVRESNGIRVTAFRTTHTRDHNSYLIECGGFRFFHDCDNEDTRPLPVAQLAGLNALLMATWRGAAWVEFIEAVQPRHWFLMHLTLDEIAAARTGGYFDGLCEHVPLPDRLVVLAPGETRQLACAAPG